MTERDDPSEVTVGGRTIEVSRPGKVLFPDDGITKSDLVEHYRRVADAAVPHLRDRPLMLRRYPDGIDGEAIVQQRAPDHFPDWVRRAEVAKRGGGTVTHVVCDDAATLVYLAGQACLTPHRWLARADAPDHPDLLVFDLDPSGPDHEASFPAVRAGARALGSALEAAGLVPFVQTTGSRGLHVVAPLDRGADFDTVRAYAREVADAVAGDDPDRLTTEQRKDKRRGRVYLDIQRNAYGQTAVAPYAVRARPGAPVAAPLDWQELAGPDMGPRRYTTASVARRLAQRDDPWAGLGRHARPLPGARSSSGSGARRVGSSRGDGR